MRRVLLIGYRLEPSNVLAVQRFLDRQMPHGAMGGCTVPVLLARRDPYRVSGPNFPRGLAIELKPSFSRHHI